MIEYEQKIYEQECLSSLGDNYLGPSLLRQLRLLGSSTLEAVGQLSPSNLKACGFSRGSVLCDDGHELRSLPDQTIQG